MRFTPNERGRQTRYSDENDAGKSTHIHTNRKEEIEGDVREGERAARDSVRPRYVEEDTVRGGEREGSR